MRRWLAPCLMLLALGGCGRDDSAPRGGGFAGLGSAVGGFREVVPGVPLAFPRDHGAHEGFRIEWWYITANLIDDQMRPWGVQWTLFRSALRPEGGSGWSDPNVWMGHVALTGPHGHRHAEAFARGGIGQAGVNADPFRAWIDGWTLQARSSGAADGGCGDQGPGDGLRQLVLAVAAPGLAYELNLDACGPLVLHGEEGYSRKSGQGQASYYYSQPFLRVDGHVEHEGRRHHVRGQAWLDREWSSQPLTADQQGWDWFSLHFAQAGIGAIPEQPARNPTGHKLMVFQVRHVSGDAYRAGTWVTPDGRAVTLRADQIRLLALEHTRLANGRRVPTRWRVEVPDFGVDAEVVALEPGAWMDTTFPYWEGPVTVSGSAAGVGYLEMTGY